MSVQEPPVADEYLFTHTDTHVLPRLDPRVTHPPMRPVAVDVPSRRRGFGWLLLVAFAVAHLGWQLLLAPAAPWHPETARFAADAWERQGVASVRAERSAAALLCADRAEQADRAARTSATPPPDLRTLEQDCLAATAQQPAPTDSLRPGYPALVALAEPYVGMTPALWGVAVAGGLVAGLGVAALLRVAGTSWGVAAAGQLAVYAGPAGWWSGQLLVDGLVLGGVAIAWCGWVMCLRGRRLLGSSTLGLGLIAVTAVSYSSVLPVAGALALAALLSWPSARRGAPFVAAGISIAVAGAVVVVARPQVPRDVVTLLAANRAYWPGWALITPANGLLVAALLVGGWALWRWWPPLAWSREVATWSIYLLTNCCQMLVR